MFNKNKNAYILACVLALHPIDTLEMSFFAT